MLRARARRVSDGGGAAGADPAPEGGAALARAGGAVTRRDAVRVDESRERPAGRYNRCSRPFRNGPQPRSWGKPGRDAKSVVPGLRPGDRRARRLWPAAAGLFWLRVVG